MLVLLGARGSGFSGAVAGALHAAGVPNERVRVLDLDDPLDGGALSVGPDFVRWRGLELTRAQALFVERPPFAWPQPIGGADRREVAALRLSALLTAAERVPVLNPPHCAELALAPVLALDALAARGVAVHGWYFAERVDDGLDWRDAVGRVLDYEPAEPALGEPAWRPEALEGELATLLVCGRRIAAAATSPSLRAWISGAAADSARAPDGVADAAAELARRATDELGLVFAAVTLGHGQGGPCVVDVEVAPRLEAWDRASRGEVARACADALLEAAATAQGAGA